MLFLEIHFHFLKRHIAEKYFFSRAEISPALSGEDGPLEETFLGGRGGGAEGPMTNAEIKKKKTCQCSGHILAK